MSIHFVIPSNCGWREGVLVFLIHRILLMFWTGFEMKFMPWSSASLMNIPILYEGFSYYSSLLIEYSMCLNPPGDDFILLFISRLSTDTLSLFPYEAVVINHTSWTYRLDNSLLRNFVNMGQRLLFLTRSVHFSCPMTFIVVPHVPSSIISSFNKWSVLFFRIF